MPTTEPRQAEAVRVFRDGLHAVVATAARAPSPHNTQPWSFAWREDGLDVRADRSRQLPVVDPDGRGLTIACGAAVFNARLATNHLGVQTRVEQFPDARDPDLLARIVPVGMREPLPEGERLHAVVPYRHTHRGTYTGQPVDPAVLVELEEAATVEGAVLHLVQHAGHRATLASLVLTAERTQLSDPRFRAEVEAWTPSPAEERRDGVPPTAYPRTRGVPDEFAVRDYSLGRGWGTDDIEEGTGESRPVVAVLASTGDHRTDWLTAGQALQRVLLSAARHWVFAALMTQPLELQHLRAVVRDELALEGYPQAIMQLGHAEVSRPTPRRPVQDVLDEGSAPDPDESG